MKKRDLLIKLRELGFYESQGTKHEKWTDGTYILPVPRHSEIKENLARGILKQAQKYKDERKK